MPKRDYKQFCPTARALNVIGERWTLLIVRDLLLDSRRYSDLRRGLPGMASNLLAVRLAEMEEAGLVTKRHVDEPTPRDVYELTERGRALEPTLVELARFGMPLLDMPTDEQPMVNERVSLGLRAMMHDAELPDSALTIRFALDEADCLVSIGERGPRGARRLPGDRVEVRPVAEGSTPRADVTVRGSMAGLLWIRQGVVDLRTAVADGLLVISGDDSSQEQLRYLYRLDEPAA